MNAKIDRFFAEHRPATPCLVVDVSVVGDNYAALAQAMPSAKIYYAIKANPAPEVLRLLVGLGSYFDTASVAEIDMVLAAGATPDRISYGNTIKKQVDITAARQRGVALFAFDSEEELDKIAAAAPGARVFCRIETSGEGAEWPLSHKFGCSHAAARRLLCRAVDLGVEPYGISFHVGSQQRYPKQWDRAIADTAALFADLAAQGVKLRMINLGGGFPARYRQEIPSPEVYGAVIDESLRRHFGNHIPEVLIEPGRGLVGGAGMIETEVVLVTTRVNGDSRRWVYLDIGKYGGLLESIDEAIQYPIISDREGPDGPVVLAGPTCDSTDVLYDKANYRLPLSLRIGDRIRIHSAGAYTTTYASIGFNGFAPLAEYYI
ncbi:ornithine decarboxylase [uncultured Gammaproteobacteria bacterium]